MSINNDDDCFLMNSLAKSTCFERSVYPKIQSYPRDFDKPYTLASNGVYAAATGACAQTLLPSLCLHGCGVSYPKLLFAVEGIITQILHKRQLFSVLISNLLL